MPIARAALTYFVAVFAIAFVMGTARTLWLAPRIGALAAVAVEVPLMLAASWFWAQRLTRRRPLPSPRAALAVGALAFVLLMATELALAVWGFGQTPAIWLASLMTPEGALGLAGQLGFAVMPWVVWGVDRR
jgi:hypothetical protein